MEGKTKVRAVYAATIIAVAAMAGGFALAAVLSSTMVNQSANFYEGGNTGANGYGSPALKVAVSPAAVASCTSTTQLVSVSGGTGIVVLSNTTGSAVCKTGDFAEEFTLSFSATVTTQTNTFTVTSLVGGGTVMTNSGTVTVGTGASSAFTATVDIFVDYGAVNPPPGGITTLDLVVQ
ncbi:MAG: hypothetical protein L3K09_00555 [Thermoplasmata archaeon]|nr:hypothetical protein [Thermoplasmata archaeon]